MNTLLVLALLAIPALAQKNGDIVVATRQTKLQTGTFLYKLPIEAQRGERWEIVKYSKGSVKLTFGPRDERRIASAQIGKTFTYDIDGKVFADSFVLESEWPAMRKKLANVMQLTFSGLSVEQCERIIEGELWIGMRREHAMEAVGNRILRKDTTETAEVKTERWAVGAFSLVTTAESSVKSHMSRSSQEPLEVKAERDVDRNTRIVLTFLNDELAEIVRR